MQKKKLTGWLILLILWIGLFSFGGGTGSLRTIKDDYQPYMADYPSLPAAITIFQLFLGAGMAVWMYAAWVLYRREPGTLAQAQICLVTSAALRIASGYAIPLFAGFPGHTVQELMQDALFLTVFLFLLQLFGICIWHGHRKFERFTPADRATARGPQNSVSRFSIALCACRISAVALT